MTLQPDLADHGPDPRTSTVFLPYPPGTRLPTQWPCWLNSACTQLAPETQVLRFSTDATGKRQDREKLAQVGHARDGLVTATERSTPLVAPMVVRGRYGDLTLPGVHETGEPGDLAWPDAASAHALARTLSQQNRPLDLPRVPLGSPSLEALARAFRGRGWVRVRSAHGSPCIELDAGWAQPLRQFNAGRQSDFRRAQRRAEQTGELQFEVHTPVPGPALDRLMDEAYEVESRGWKGSGGTALAVDPLLGPFYRRLARAAAQSGQLRLCFLRIAGQAAAMQLALQGEGRFWLMKMGYDAAYARCSPGQLLMLHTIGHAASQGLVSYEMLGNAAAWTAGWTRTLRPFVRVRAYPASCVLVRRTCALRRRLSRGLGTLAVPAQPAATPGSTRMNMPTQATYATLKRWAYAWGEPVLQRASRAYVPGPRLDDAVHWARQRAPTGCRFTFGYFNAEQESPDQVERACQESILALATLNPGNADMAGYCSLKVPPLGYAAGALQRLAQQAAAHGQRLHFDSHGPETAQPTLAALDALRPHHACLGLTVPGRWARSLEDAEWAAQRGLRVRVVKGQWPCLDQPDADPRQGFLAVIDRLAGRVSEVAVATHDAALAREAARRLETRGTACELELLCGLPRRGVMDLARSQALPMRLYVPFGQAWLPYAFSQVLRQPGLWPRLLKDSLAEAWQPAAR